MRNPLRRLSLLLAVVAILIIPRAYPASIPLAPLPLPNGPVNDVYVSDEGRLYLAGAFTLLDGSEVRNGLAAIDVTSGAIVSSWAPSLSDGGGGAGIGEVLLPSVDGKTLYVGGRFADVDAVAHQHIAAIDIDPNSASYGQAKSWDPELTGTSVLALSLSSSGTTLYVGGEFTASGRPGLPRQNLAAIDVTTAETLPWIPDPDGIVHDILLAPDGSRVYVAGEFTTIGSSDGRDYRSALAALNPGNAAVLNWDASLTAVAVYTMLLSDDGASLTIGGDFSQADVDSRANLARLDSSTAVADSGWIVDTDGPVFSLIDTATGNLFVGGAYAAIQGQVRENLAMLRGDTATLLPWSPQVGVGVGGASVLGLAVDSTNNTLLVAGDYGAIGTDASYQNLAAYSIEPPVTVSDSGGVTASQSTINVTLSCTDQVGGACMVTYLTTDGTEPTTASTIYSAPMPISSTTTLKYFSVDSDGNREVVHSEAYIIELTAPQTTASPGPLTTDSPLQRTLNAQTYGSLELLCNDDVDGSGCATTYYTLDGTVPTTMSAVYDAPIVLPDGITTVSFFSVDQAANEETPVTSVEYTVDRDLPTISVSHDSGNYAPPLDVTIVCDDGAGTGCGEIYLVTDGSVPSTSATSFTYGGPINLTLSSASVLRIQVSDLAGNTGLSIVGIYTFTDPTPLKRNGSGAVDGLLLLLLALFTVVRRRSD